jgi:hypothetical protein
MNKLGREQRFPNAGRHYATKRRNKVGEVWISYLRSMTESPALRVLSIHAILVMRRIEVEHMAHGAAENGRLIVTYDQFVEWGVERRQIGPAIRELVALGFLEVTERGVAGNETYRRANKFRLTYVNTKNREEPTHEWRRINTIEDAKITAENARSQKDGKATAKGRRSAKARAQKRIPVAGLATVSVAESATDRPNLQLRNLQLRTSVAEPATTI